MFGQIEEIDRTIEWWVRNSYELEYVITRIFKKPLPDFLKDPNNLYCVQSGIRDGETYARATADCYRLAEFRKVQEPSLERVAKPEPVAAGDSLMDKIKSVPILVWGFIGLVVVNYLRKNAGSLT